MKTFIKQKLAGLKNKLIAIRANPFKVCMGYALGIFLATTPFIGLKVFIAIFLTYLFRWSKVAAIVGVFHVNLLTAPLFYSVSYIVGNAVLVNSIGFSAAAPLSLEGLLAFKTMSLSIFMSLLIGGLILGLPLAFISYIYSYYLIKGRKTCAHDIVCLKNSCDRGHSINRHLLRADNFPVNTEGISI
jgi:uncharacterized protein (DUF2062 family)